MNPMSASTRAASWPPTPLPGRLPRGPAGPGRDSAPAGEPSEATEPAFSAVGAAVFAAIVAPSAAGRLAPAAGGAGSGTVGRAEVATPPSFAPMRPTVPMAGPVAASLSGRSRRADPANPGAHRLCPVPRRAQRLREQIARTASPLDRAVTEAALAAQLASLGRFEEAAALRRSAQSEAARTPHARLSVALAVAEAAAELDGDPAFADRPLAAVGPRSPATPALHGPARERLRRALALAEAHRLAPSVAEAATWLARIEFDAGEPCAGLGHLERALAAGLAGPVPRAWVVLGQALQEGGDAEGATQAYARARREAQDDGDDAALLALTQAQAWAAVLRERDQTLFTAIDAALDAPPLPAVPTWRALPAASRLAAAVQARGLWARNPCARLDLAAMVLETDRCASGGRADARAALALARIEAWLCAPAGALPWAAAVALPARAWLAADRAVLLARLARAGDEQAGAAPSRLGGEPPPAASLADAPVPVAPSPADAGVLLAAAIEAAEHSARALVAVDDGPIGWLRCAAWVAARLSALHAELGDAAAARSHGARARSLRQTQHQRQSEITPALRDLLARHL